MTNSEANVPATAPEAAPIVLLAPNVTLQTGCVNAFHVIVEASVKVCSGLKAALVNDEYPPSLNSTSDVPSY